MSNWIIVRGGGDLATGTIHRLWSVGFPVLVLETDAPSAIRRQVSACEAIYEGRVTIEGMTAARITTIEEAEVVFQRGEVPVLVDPQGEVIPVLRPAVVVDGILAKKNLGTHRNMAPLTVALGPGFIAGKDVDVVIETKRGHNLGRLIREGAAAKNTGIPGMIGGYAAERVIHAAQAGILKNSHHIGDVVGTGEPIAMIVSEDGTEYPIPAPIPGIIRGLIRDGYQVPKGFKIADIDPRLKELSKCFTISDKARCI